MADRRFETKGWALSLSRPGDCIRRAEALSEDASEVENKAEREPRMREPQPLKGCLRQDECFGRLERNDVG